MAYGTAPPLTPRDDGSPADARAWPMGAAMRTPPAPPAATASTSTTRTPVGAVLPAVVLGLAALALWQLARSTGAAPALILPAPGDVLHSFWLLVTLPQFRGSIQGTVIVSLGGCAVGAIVALPLGYLLARSRLVALAVQPYLAASQAVPAIAIASLLALWLGYGFTPRFAICALVVFFPLVVTTTLGLRGLDRDILDAARVEGADRWALFWQIELPLALPSILAGLRASLTLSITGAVVGDFVLGGGEGLGGLLIGFSAVSNTPGVFATLLLLAILAAIYYGLARLVERRFSYLEAR
jgi:NitT/TauT family transport system permease protein